MSHSANCLDSPQLLEGETPDPTSIPPGCRFHPRCPVAFDRCPVEDPAPRPAPGGTGDHRAACLLV
jgi:oligopeptide/dipeptide ABC transporter ATP-binding protein